MGFYDNIKETLNQEKVLTENGAVAYKTSGKALVDLNFALSSLRNESEEKIRNQYWGAYSEDFMLAVKWLFYARDIRGGAGERRTFRVIFKDLANTNSAVARKLIPLVPVYGRWDDLWCLEKTPVWDTVISVVKEQLASDLAGANAKAPVSLLAKWLPSLYTSSEETCRLARAMANDLKMRPEEYNAALGTLRSYLKIVEKLMSRGEWDKIDYKAVPSKANVLYNAAFLRHDEARRRAFLEAVEKGETKINASALFPYEIVAKIQEGKSDKRALEAMWKALPDTVKGNDSTIVVADGSGSMCQYIGNTSVLALNACHSLAIYFAERCSGDFKDKYITFSANPKIVDLSGVSTLIEKLRIAHSHSDISNTNIEKVFALLLRTAKEHNTNPQDMPKNILILSDLEFNAHSFNLPGKTLFETIRADWEAAGYELPRLIFWNLCSRTKGAPLQENKNGLALVSGFSQNIVTMVMGESFDPYNLLLETLNSDRYRLVEEMLT